MRLKTLLSLFTGISGALVGYARGEPLDLGQPIPAITVTNEEGDTFPLTKNAASGYTLVYFYPKADTPGCTAQSCSLRDAYAELTDKGVTIYGVSMDKAEDQKAFKKAHQLPFTLIADPDGKVVEAFGVPRRGQFASRQAFLFQDGKLVWRDLSASTRKQADDVLAAIKQP